MTDKEGKHYAVILSISPATPERLQSLVPKLLAVLSRLSTEPVEAIFRSVGADHFGYVIRSKLRAAQIDAAIESPRRGYVSSLDSMADPFLTNQDGVLVMEVGEDFHSIRGFSRVATWLQRH